MHKFSTAELQTSSVLHRLRCASANCTSTPAGPLGYSLAGHTPSYRIACGSSSREPMHSPGWVEFREKANEKGAREHVRRPELTWGAGRGDQVDFSLVSERIHSR